MLVAAPRPSGKETLFPGLNSGRDRAALGGYETNARDFGCKAAANAASAKSAVQRAVAPASPHGAVRIWSDPARRFIKAQRRSATEESMSAHGDWQPEKV